MTSMLGSSKPPRVKVMPMASVGGDAKRDQRRSGRAGSGIFLLVLLGATLVALAHVAVHARRVEVALALAREQSENRAMGEQRRRLRIELERLRDPARLVRLGREQLGMGEPEPGNIRSLRLASVPLTQTSPLRGQRP